MSRRPIDLTGKRIGRWTVLRYAGRELWLCRCDCGQEREVIGSNLRSNGSLSCGCLARELTGQRATKHGGFGTPEYEIWHGMIQRCHNSNCKDFPRYGGRGIVVCEKWRSSFAAFLEDMGPRPSPQYSVDRERVNGNYEPGNCRWATVKQQQRNRRSNRLVMVDGKEVTVTEAAELHGLPKSALFIRLKNGWPLDRALNTPLRKTKRVQYASR